MAVTGCEPRKLVSCDSTFPVTVTINESIAVLIDIEDVVAEDLGLEIVLEVPKTILLPDVTPSGEHPTKLGAVSLTLAQVAMLNEIAFCWSGPEQIVARQQESELT